MNNETIANNKRIIKNTGLLYVRMLLAMVVSLYTVRIVFNALGVVDYGIYGVVGGFVSLFVFMNGALSSSTSRFIAFELGVKGSSRRVKRIFQTAFTINFFFALILLIILQTIGLWLMNHYLNIPDERLHAANWVFQMSVLCAVINILKVPLTALIIAHEKMNIYAYLGIMDVFIKLGIAFYLQYTGYDKLIAYAVLIAVSSILILVLYHIYCKRKFGEYQPLFLFDKKHLVNMLGFSGWGFIGSFTVIMKLQGVNVLLNLFFGPAVNASRSIAYQVNHAINNFTQNFITALRPQIIKYYAAGEINNMTELLISGTKFSYFMLFLLALPVLLETRFLLNLWLGNVPEYAVIFTKLVIINSFCESFTYSMYAALQATGQIRAYQLGVGGFLLLNVPISYLFFKIGFRPETALIISIMLAICSLALRVMLIKKQIPQFPVRKFVGSVFGVSFLVSLLSSPFPIFVSMKFQPGWYRLLFSTTTCITVTILSIWILGLNKSEKRFIRNLIYKKRNGL